jgi:acyl-CoA thioesterase I
MGERYVALGDSYTIGEGVSPNERWPNLLVAQLQQGDVDIELVANPSVSGWTTQDLIERALPGLPASRPTFATLLIGVNDWVQEVPADAFRTNLGHIIDRVQEVLPDPRRLVLVTIPDFSVTPNGRTYARGRDISQGILSFNEIILEEAWERKLESVDIYPLSRRLGARSYIAEDGLHPSAAAYAMWVRSIVPVAMDVLTGKE